MRLLVVTQAVNLDNPALGFFHGWIDALSKAYESVTVICLEKGRHALPSNVRVLSLGKEERASRIGYVSRFLGFAWKERHAYDAVFVHMNQEYVLLGGLVWKALQKPVHFWRNHAKGSILTDMSVALSEAVYYTSPFSYTSRFKKAVRMPVGIDTDRFAPGDPATDPGSILFLSRMDPVKRPDVVVRALEILRKNGVPFSADFVGSPTPGNERYFADIRADVERRGLLDTVRFSDSVNNEQAPEWYRSHSIYINATDHGSFDKTILEAASCGSLILVSNASLAKDIPSRFIFKENDAEDCAQRLKALIEMPAVEREASRALLRSYVEKNHSLATLIGALGASIRHA